MVVPVKLFILGQLAQKERYGYEIRATARRVGLGHWGGFGLGSLYHALAALEKAGDIAERRTERAGRYPARSVYAITRQGRETVARLMVEVSQDVRHEDPIDVALGLLPLLPAEERRQLLTLRIDRLVGDRRDREHALRQFREHGAEPWVFASADRSIRVAKAQIDWLKELLGAVKDWTPADRRN